MYKNNKNGFLTEQDLLDLKALSEEEFRNYIADNTGILKCPPEKYKTVDCFYCVTCIRNAKNLAKEKKVK